MAATAFAAAYLWIVRTNVEIAVAIWCACSVVLAYNLKKFARHVIVRMFTNNARKRSGARGCLFDIVLGMGFVACALMLGIAGGLAIVMANIAMDPLFR
jgi:hypothetical protein